MLNATEKYKMKMTLHLEPYAKQTAETVRRDIEYIVEKYGSHPAFYRTSRKNATKGQKELPLLYAYDSYRIPVDEWTKLTSPNGSLSIRNTTFDVLLIGMDLFSFSLMSQMTKINTGWRKKVVFFTFWDLEIYFSKNDPSRGNFIRCIDCAHSRTLKMLPFPDF